MQPASLLDYPTVLMVDLCGYLADDVTGTKGGIGVFLWATDSDINQEITGRTEAAGRTISGISVNSSDPVSAQR